MFESSQWQLLVTEQLIKGNRDEIVHARALQKLGVGGVMMAHSGVSCSGQLSFPHFRNWRFLRSSRTLELLSWQTKADNNNHD